MPCALSAHLACDFVAGRGLLAFQWCSLARRFLEPASWKWKEAAQENFPADGALNSKEALCRIVLFCLLHYSKTDQEDLRAWGADDVY